MADKKISQLIAASTPLSGTELVELVQGGNNVKATAQDVADLVDLTTIQSDISTLQLDVSNNTSDITVLQLDVASLQTGKQDNITLTTTGTSGAATLVGSTLNIPQYSGGGGIAHTVASGTDTYTATVTGVTSYADGDAYLVKFTNGNTTGCSLNINSIGDRTLFRNNDGALIGGDIWANGEMLCVYDSALDGGAGGFQCIGTSPNSIFAYVTNDDSVSITKGQVVYAFSGTGDRMTVKRANNTTDATSARTIGMVYSSSIAAGQKGIIILQGLITGLANVKPINGWQDGDIVYLDNTNGGITRIKPYAPNHLVYVGIVTSKSPGSAGIVYVKVQNGYELDELHDVQAQSPSNKDTLYYDSVASQWKTASIATILGYTPVTDARTISTSSPLSGGGDLTANRTISIADAAADGTTKGAAAFTASDFNSAAGVISIDYTNGQAASGSNKGFLTSADWTTFNSKEPSITTGTTAQYWRGDKSWQTLDKTAVGLGNVDNTSDATKNSATATLTNKRITARTGTVASTGTPSINIDNVDYYSITALATPILSVSYTGTPTTGQTLWISITDNGAAKAIAWGSANWEPSGNVALPTATVAGVRLDVAFIWNEATSKWRCVGVA